MPLREIDLLKDYPRIKRSNNAERTSQETTPMVMVLGGGSALAQHFCRYVLDHSDWKVQALGRHAEPGPAWRLCDAKRDSRYFYTVARADAQHAFGWIRTQAPHVVVNFAALAAAEWRDAWQYWQTNTVDFARMVEAVCEQWRTWPERPFHWVQIGSSEVYGSCDHPVVETDRCEPTHPYSASKLGADLELRALWETFGFPMTILRPSNAYGECQQLRRIIPRAVLAALTGQKVPLQGGGLARKSYIHAEDLAAAVFAACRVEPKGEIYHVGAASSTTIHDLVGHIADLFGLTFNQLVEDAPGRITEDKEYLLDSSKILDRLGWQPTIGLHDGLQRVIAWAWANLPDLKATDPAWKLMAQEDMGAPALTTLRGQTLDIVTSWPPVAALHATATVAPMKFEELSLDRP